MPTTENLDFDISEQPADEIIDDAVEKIVSGNYKEAYNLLIQEYSPAASTRNTDYRDERILMNHLSKEFTDLLSVAATNERYPSTSSLEETEKKLQRQAEKYLEE